MKFTDGNWLLQPDVTAFYPVEARDRMLARHAFTVYATKRINHRGDTLSGPLLTVECSAPMPDIIRVKMTHFAGTQTRQPTFIRDDVVSTDVQMEDDEQATTLTSGKLSVRIPHGEPWQVDFVADGRVVTSSGRRGMGIIQRDDGTVHIERQGDAKPWQALLIGATAVGNADGGHAEQHARGTLVMVPADGHAVRIQLRAES